MFWITHSSWDDFCSWVIFNVPWVVYGGLICVVPGPGSTSTLNTLRLGETAPLGFTFPWQLWAHWSCHALQTTGPVLAEPRSAVGGGGFACASQMSSEHFGKGLKEKLHVCFSPAKNWSYIHMYIYIYISLSLFFSICVCMYIYISLSLSLPLSLSLAIYNKRMSHPLKKLCILRLSLLWGLGPLHQRGCAQPPSGGSGLLLKSYFSADLCCIFWLKTSQNHINSYIYIYIQINKSIDK